MKDLQFTILSFAVSLLLLLTLMMVAAMMYLLWKSNSQANRLLTNQLKTQLLENQSLRNQLRSSDLVTLGQMNQLTLPVEAIPNHELNSNNFEDLSIEDLGQLVYDEEQRAAAGFSTGEVSDDLSAAGWNPPIVRDGESYTY